MTRSFWLLVATGLLTSAPSVLSHHAVSDVYDESRTVMVRGEIVALVYRNPHSILHVDVEATEGQRTWAVEWRAATRLRDGGVSPGILRPGDVVVVCGNPGRDPGAYRLLLQSLTRPADGWASHQHACDRD